MTLATTLAALLVSAFTPYVDEPDVPKLSAALTSTSRDERLKALADVHHLPTVPGSLAKPLAASIRLDLQQSYVKAAPPSGRAKEAIKNVPFEGDEVSLTRLKADPDQYIGKTFILVGGLMIGDYYNFGYGDASPTHYSLKFMPAAKDGSLGSGEQTSLYLDRSIGRVLTGRITLMQEENAGPTAFLARLHCTVLAHRIGSRLENITSAIEIIDWQYIGPDDKWGPTATQVIRDAMIELRRAGGEGIRELVSLLASEEVPGEGIVEGAVRDVAVATLDHLDPDQRKAARPALMRVAKKVRPDSPTARSIEMLLYAAKSGSPDAKKSAPDKKKIDLAIRAKTKLASAKALEKTGKIKSALEWYQAVVDDFPGTPAAKEAAGCVERLKGK